MSGRVVRGRYSCKQIFNDIIDTGHQIIKLNSMLIFLHRTYRGRTHKWWLQSGIIFALVFLLFLCTYYFINLYTEYQQLMAESKRLAPYIVVEHKQHLIHRQAGLLSRVNITHDYLQYLNQFERFEKKASFAKLLRVYRSKQVLYRQKNNLELALTSDMIVPIMLSLGNELTTYSQKWDKASFAEKNRMQFMFKQRILTYEMVTKRHGYKILSSEWMKELVIQSWYDFLQKQVNEQNHASQMTLPSYQELYPKLDQLVEFYFQLPHVESNWIKPDQALLEKTKNQLNLNNDADIFIS